METTPGSRRDSHQNWEDLDFANDIALISTSYRHVQSKNNSN